jgi:hypothetical protein
MWESNTTQAEKGYTSDDFFVPAATLGFSVIVFCVVAVIGIICLIVRRQVVGGELGGSQTGRTGSAIFMVTLWCIYIMMSIFQSFNIGGIGEQGWGIDISAQALNPNRKCWTDKHQALFDAANLVSGGN